jgi:hypothetical protein
VVSRKPIVVTIPHRMTKAEARSRIAGGMGQIRGQLAPFASAVEESWDEDRLDFRVVALGQTVAGRIDVEDENVRVEVDLPWMLAALGRKIADRVRHQGTLLLEKK